MNGKTGRLEQFKCALFIMSDRTDGEKITALEIEMKNISQKVDDNYKASTMRFDKIDLSIQEVKNIVTDKYVNKDSFTEKIKDLETKIDELKGQSTFWKWAAPTLSAAVATIITGLISFLLFFYLQNN